MIGIYMICFIFFPIAIFIQAKWEKRTQVFWEKEDSDVVKGIAACLIILTHLVLNLNETAIMPLLNIFGVTGGMGVLIFFFMSGYGIFKGYAYREPGIYFWKKRLFSMCLPCILIQLFFIVFEIFVQRDFDIHGIIYNSFLNTWFIDVIMIQYLIFYFAWVFMRGKQNVLMILSFLFSAITAGIFYVCGMNPRWYNGLLLFPIGMLLAWKEEKWIIFINRKWVFYLFFNAAAFVIWGGVFTYGKGNITGIDIFKVLAGIHLCLLIATIYVRMQFHSSIMKYIGKRSLFFYLIHINLLSIISKIDMYGIRVFYVVLLLTFGITDISYRLYQLCRKKVFFKENI